MRKGEFSLLSRGIQPITERKTLSPAEKAWRLRKKTGWLQCIYTQKEEIKNLKTLSQQLVSFNKAPPHKDSTFLKVLYQLGRKCANM